MKRPALLLALLPVAALALSAPPRSEPIRYNRDIRPILSDNCFACHGPDKNKRQANLRLDRPGNAAIVPGKPEKSPLVARVFGSGAAQMPPASFHKSLTAAQKNLLKRWVAQGAPYEAHWAYAPLTRPAVPKVAGGAIDAFVRARLAKEGIAPSPEADRRTLIRRVSLDLTGLPPTPEEVAAFVKDTRSDAYVRVVDRLLASPHYGERMALPWLDAVRYADTVGYHGDQNTNAWAYRDWVIDAFNKNKPFARFTAEQLAGDLLPGADAETRTGSCFNRLNMVTREGGAQPGEYLHKYNADRVRTVGMAWLGSTFACAECHDHKYDPISQKDFYSLAAFFGDVKQWGVYADYDYTPNPDLRGVGNDHPFFPEIQVGSPFLRRRIAQRQRQIDDLAARTGDPAAQKAWLATVQPLLRTYVSGWIPLPDGPSAPPVPWVASILLQLVPEKGSVLAKGAASGSVSLRAAVVDAGGKERPVAFRHASADRFAPRYESSFAQIGVQRGWSLRAPDTAAIRTGVWRPAAPIALAPGERLKVTVAGAARPIVAVSPLVPTDPDGASLPVHAVRSADPDRPLEAEVRRAWLMGTAADPTAFAQARQWEADIAACRGGETPVMVTETFATPLTFRVLPRGNWQDESGPVTPPATPSFLPAAGVAPERRLTRLDLARWLTGPDNPLVARVFVNRLWKLFFGVGLSASVEDLGAQGEAPSHPELLDWLAADFRNDGDIKRAVRQIVLSQTYRQSAAPRPELRERDPANRLLARQSPRRLEAELVRDNALAIAGLLNRDRGGPPAKPYQPAGYYAQLQFPDREYEPSRDESQWRRGVYMHWQRTFLHPMLAAFDAPSREEPTCTRTSANTPQQALTLLNDPEFVEAARAFAARTVADDATDDARLERLFQRALARSPKPAEKRSLTAFLNRTRAGFKERPADAAKLVRVGLTPAPVGDTVELAAWTQLCRVVLNLHETITRY